MARNQSQEVLGEKAFEDFSKNKMRNVQSPNANGINVGSEESIGKDTEGFGGYTDDVNQNNRDNGRGNVSATRRNVNNPI